MSVRTRWGWLGGVFALAFMLSACDQSFFETTDGSVDDGNEALQKGEAALAIGHYEAAAADLPESPELSFDRGLALVQADRWEEGTQELFRALDSRDPELRFKIFASLGVAYGQWGQEMERRPAAAPPVDDDPSGALGGRLALPRR